MRSQLHLTWGSSVLNVDELGLAGLRMLVTSMAGMVIEDCVDSAALTARAIEALDNQKLPSETMLEQHSFNRSVYWKALATVVQTTDQIDYGDPPTALQLTMRARAILASPAFATRLPFENLRTLGQAHQLAYPGPLPLFRTNVAANGPMYEPLGPLGPQWSLDQLTSGQEAFCDATSHEERSRAFVAFMCPLLYLSRALIEIIAPSTDTDYILQEMEYSGWSLTSMRLDGVFDLAALRARAQQAKTRLTGGTDAAPLPALAADERGLAGLLAVGEGVAATLVPMIPPCEQVMFKLVCRRFRVSQMMHGAADHPYSAHTPAMVLRTRSSLRHIVQHGTLRLFEWAVALS